MNSAKTRRILIWGFPILMAGVLLLFPVADRIIRSIDRDYQESLQALNDWTYLDKRCTDIATDFMGRIWMAGGRCRKVLHMFDGEKWFDSNSPVNIGSFAVDLNGQVWVIPDLWDGEPSVSV